MVTHPCSNCGTEFTFLATDSIRVVHGIESEGEVATMPIDVVALCPDCLKGAKTLKLVLKRNITGQFEYEQFSVLEMANRAFGAVG